MKGSKIIELVSKETGIEAELITSKSRVAPVMKARKLAILLMNEVYESQSKIALHFDQDQSNISYCLAVAKDLLVTDPSFKAQFNKIKSIQL